MSKATPTVVEPSTDSKPVEAPNPVQEFFSNVVKGFGDAVKHAETEVRRLFEDEKHRKAQLNGARDLLCFTAAVTQNPHIRTLCSRLSSELDEAERISANELVGSGRSRR